MFHNFRVNDSWDEAPGPSDKFSSVLSDLASELTVWYGFEETSGTRFDSVDVQGGGQLDLIENGMPVLYT